MDRTKAAPSILQPSVFTRSTLPPITIVPPFVGFDARDLFFNHPTIRPRRHLGNGWTEAPLTAGGYYGRSSS